MQWNIVIGAICAVAGVLLSWAAFHHSEKNADKEDGKETGVVLTELGYIKGGIDDLKAEQREQRKTNTEMVTRLTAVEASAKQAHKRLDRIEGREDRE